MFGTSKHIQDWAYYNQDTTPGTHFSFSSSGNSTSGNFAVEIVNDPYMVQQNTGMLMLRYPFTISKDDNGNVVITLKDWKNWNPVLCTCTVIDSNGSPDFEFTWTKHLDTFIKRVPIITPQSKYKSYCKEIYKAYLVRIYGQQGGQSKAHLKSTSASITFTKDGKKVKRVVHVNARGTKVVKYNGAIVPVSKLRVVV